MKKKSNTKGILIFIGVVLLIDVVFFPVLMNLVLLPLLTGTPAGGIGILNWSKCFDGMVATQITVGFEIMIFAGFAALYASSIKPSFAHGDEHGSARLLTDEEFDKLIPNYLFNKNDK
ncbi:MAG: hypothetical protein Q4B60_09155 [Erysipelotrichaceae bacterium]|nr:hypothetical protein [Erysipelotrichaceae bacterium]